MFTFAPPAMPAEALPRQSGIFTEALAAAWRLVWWDGVCRGAIVTAVVILVLFVAADLARRPR